MKGDSKKAKLDDGALFASFEPESSIGEKVMYSRTIYGLTLALFGLNLFPSVSFADPTGPNLPELPHEIWGMIGSNLTLKDATSLAQMSSLSSATRDDLYRIKSAPIKAYFKGVHREENEPPKVNVANELYQFMASEQPTPVALSEMFSTDHKSMKLFGVLGLYGKEIKNIKINALPSSPNNLKYSSSLLVTFKDGSKLSGGLECSSEENSWLHEMSAYFEHKEITNPDAIRSVLSAFGNRTITPSVFQVPGSNTSTTEFARSALIGKNLLYFDDITVPSYQFKAESTGRFVPPASVSTKSVKEILELQGTYFPKEGEKEALQSSGAK
jgi:hypothetical protein